MKPDMPAELRAYLTRAIADRFDLHLLAGVLVAGDSAGRGDSRRFRQAYALWARIFTRPRQTDLGCPKKLCRRAQRRLGVPDAAPRRLTDELSNEAASWAIGALNDPDA